MPVTRFAFKLTSGQDNYIDLAQCMSLVQRTLVRQKQKFTVLGGQLVDNAQGSVKISTAPNFWYTRAAINRGFSAWKQMRAKTLANAELESVGPNAVGKYSDFKVTLNGVSSTIRPVIGANFSQIAEGEEWNLADLENEAGDSKLLKICGDHSSSYYGLMRGWLSLFSQQSWLFLLVRCTLLAHK